MNLSTLHFNSDRILKVVQTTLDDANFPPNLLTLEITESTEMRDWGKAQEIITGLHSLGCRIAIDDFGTGFSSLAYLRAIAADELKVDKSLIFELETSEKARLTLASVFDIARNLELEIIVEGIETHSQAHIVYSMGADIAQGYLFAAPDLPETALKRAMYVANKLQARAAS